MITIGEGRYPLLEAYLKRNGPEIKLLVFFKRDGSDCAVEVWTGPLIGEVDGKIILNILAPTLDEALTKLNAICP